MLPQLKYKWNTDNDENVNVEHFYNSLRNNEQKMFCGDVHFKTKVTKVMVNVFFLNNILAYIILGSF